MKKVVIKGMSCEHCVKAVKQALEDLGLGEVNVDLGAGTASFAEAKLTEQSVRDAIDDAGFEVTAIE